MPIPPGFTTVFPYIFATGARAYLDFLAAGLGAEVVNVHASADGIVLNAQVRFGDTTLMISEAQGNRGPSRSSQYLYVEDADAAMARAVAAGGRSLGAVADMPYGDRQGGVEDRCGNIWWLSQRLVPGPYQPGGGKLARGELSFVEIGTADPDVAQSQSFFQGVFGWNFHPMPKGGWFQTASIRIGLHGNDPGPQIYLFFAVADLEEAMAAVRKHGGEADPATGEEPGFGRFSICRDPQGIRFGLHQTSAA